MKNHVNKSTNLSHGAEKRFKKSKMLRMVLVFVPVDNISETRSKKDKGICVSYECNLFFYFYFFMIKTFFFSFFNFYKRQTRE